MPNGISGMFDTLGLNLVCNRLGCGVSILGKTRIGSLSFLDRFLLLGKSGLSGF